MSDPKCFFITTAIDYPNSRPHIGTAFEKVGADVQARYRRMEGYNVFFLMGNDENTIKVAKRAAELGQEPQPYVDDMARQFQEVWRSLSISHDDFIQTSELRHHHACRQFIQKVYDNGYIRQGTYEGWYCDGCESFKTEKELEAGQCPVHKTPAVRRSEPCYFFELSRFQDRLLSFFAEHPDFIQPESRRNEVVSLVKGGLEDINISRTGQEWGIKIPWDEGFTIYVWFDALLNYISAIGYGSNETRFRKWWPADIHFIGKDITRFHCALWPAMLMAAELTPPRMVFGHGFLTKDGEKISKSLGNVVEPDELVKAYGSDAYRYFFMRECPFPGDGDYSFVRFKEVVNTDLANNLGNLYSRVVKLVSANYDGVLAGTAGVPPEPVEPGLDPDLIVAEIREHVESCQYNLALAKVVEKVLDPANRYAEVNVPWKLVKTDKDAARPILFNLVEPLRQAAILLKPFIPHGTETIYRSFNFVKPWEAVCYADAAEPGVLDADLQILAQLQDGKVKPLYPRIA